MPYIDEEILEAKRKQEHQKYTTLETGTYAGDELITFAQIEIPDTKISLFLFEFLSEKGSIEHRNKFDDSGGSGLECVKRMHL